MLYQIIVLKNRTFLNSVSEIVTDSETKIKYKPYFVDDMENVNKLGPKLSNQENQ